MLYRPSWLAYAALAAMLAACSEGSGIIEDDWGPPAGYAVLAGTLQRATGGPAAGVKVSFTRCGSPINGYLASTTSDAAGIFRVGAQLPPIGFLPRLAVDSVQLHCYVFLDRTGTIRDSVIVRFAGTAQAAPVTSLALQIP